MTKKETKEVKRILSNVDKEFVNSFLNKINLSLRENEVIRSTELDKITVFELAEKMCLSPDAINYIKKAAVKKIYKYSLQNNYIKITD